MTDYNKLFNEKMGELMQAVQFPIESIPKGFENSVCLSLLNHTTITLDCSIDEYERVYHSTLSDNQMWFMPQMFIALSALKNSTPNQINCTHEIWILSQRVFQSMSEKWDTIAAPYIEQAKKYVSEVSRRDQREAEAKARIVKFNGAKA